MQQSPINHSTLIIIESNSYARRHIYYTQTKRTNESTTKKNLYKLHKDRYKTQYKDKNKGHTSLVRSQISLIDG